MSTGDDPSYTTAVEVRRRRARYHAWRRGTREMDLILGRFADARMAGFDADELAGFERLLALPDPDLFAWVTGRAPVPENHDIPVLRMLLAFHAEGAQG